MENKIILAKLEIIYIELICKNINCLCLINDPNKNKIINILKNSSIRLIKLLINFLQIPESGFIEPELTFEEVVCIYLKQMASNINDESFYNQQLGNLPKIMEIIAQYETNANEIKGNLVKSMIITVIYLINIIERLTNKEKNTIFKCLYKNVKYNKKDILEEKNEENKNTNRFSIFYEHKNKLIIYDKLFLYECSYSNEKDIVEIKDIEFIKNTNIISDTSGKKINLKINNIIIFFDNNEESSKICHNLEENFKKLKDFFPKNYAHFNLKNIFNYVEKL